MSYEIQQFTLCGGWVNTWTIEHEDGTIEPSLFDSYAEANDELSEFLRDSDEAYFNGWIEDRYQWHEYRIVEILK